MPLNAAERERNRRNKAAYMARMTPEQKRARLAYFRGYLARNPDKKRMWTATKNRNRRHGKQDGTPGWVNVFFVQEIYDLARRREAAVGFAWHVDHVVPLRSRRVCGLHSEHNLRVIPGAHNASKGNRHWPDMPDKGATP